MRFFTLLAEKNQKDFVKDKAVSAFWEWIHASGYAKKNPHAGIAQILLFMQCEKPPHDVKLGFVRVAMDYQKLSGNALPLHLKEEKELSTFLNQVF